MIAMGVEPGTHTISAAVLGGLRTQPTVLGVLVLRPESPDAEIRKRVVSLSLQATMLGAWVQHFGVSDVVVEGQHFHERKQDPDDIINLAAVAGACLLGAQMLSPQMNKPHKVPRVLYAAAGEWSRMDKKMRANRITDLYLPGQCARAQIQKLTPVKLSAREHGDVLDAIGMAYWAMLEYPRAGV
jgi:Holliday junction resolvasome RuvABC endonuclease subunit